MCELHEAEILEHLRKITTNTEKTADMGIPRDLMLVLREFFREQEASQAKIAQMIGVPQPRVSELMTAKSTSLSSGQTDGFLAKVGIQIQARNCAADKDRP